MTRVVSMQSSDESSSVQAERWVLITLVLAALPSLFHLPIWVDGLVIFGAIFHFAGRWRKGWTGKLITGLFLLTVVVAIYFSFDSWFSGDAILSFFISVVFLKWAESHGRRDYFLLIFSAVILSALGALYWENLLTLIHMFVVVISLLTSLMAIHAHTLRLSGFDLLKKTVGMFLLGLPIMAILFLIFPRISGPLWDIGLAFGLPVKALMETGSSDFGAAKILKPGAAHKTSQDAGNVLVAEFQGAVPTKNQMYWRGPVFWNFDGEDWHLEDGWDNRTRLLKRALRTREKLESEFRRKDHPINYSLRVMPNGGRWLYALDVPAATAPESFISDEYQLLSIRKVIHEPKLEMQSYLDYEIGKQITDEQRTKGLAWSTERTNPRLFALGQELSSKFDSSELIIQQVYRLLASGDYTFDAGHIIESGPDMLDRFFFDLKKGGSEYLAGSFAMLMRASGIPARLVSGFRGGSIIALTNFVIVKKTHAHTWVEVWLDKTGWTRIEPKDLIMPVKDDASSKKEKQAAVPILKNKEKAPITKELEAAGGDKKSAKDNPSKDQSKWELPSWSDLFGGLQKWVVNYNPNRQMELLKGVGVKQANLSSLLVGSVIAISTLLGLYLLFYQLIQYRKIDPVSRAWTAFKNKLSRKGIKLEVNECPRDYGKRVVSMRPDYAIGVEDIVDRYISIRYGADSSKQEVLMLTRQVKRFIAMI